MNCKTRNRWRTASGTGVPQRRAGFTLVEVLAAMLFLAIVIPVAVAGLRTAGLAGEVSTRKAAACRIAERVLNESIVTGQTQKSALSGTIHEGALDFRWTMNIESSGLEDMKLATVDVTFPAQGKDYDVQLSTLVNSQ
jgi:prepilin-type N-terminal cleavage/methylation domain-containing protein